MLFALLLAAANPIPANAAVADTAYVADCETYTTAAVCRCIADRLQRSHDGRLVLELATVKAAAASQTKAQLATAQTAICNRYGVTCDKNLGERIHAVWDPAYAACKAKGTP